MSDLIEIIGTMSLATLAGLAIGGFITELIMSKVSYLSDYFCRTIDEAPTEEIELPADLISSSQTTPAQTHPYHQLS